MKSHARVKDDPKITSLKEIDLQSLAETRDAKDTFLSVYFGTIEKDRSQSFVASRLSLIKKALPKDLLGAFQETLGMAEVALSAPGIRGERGRVVFA